MGIGRATSRWTSCGTRREELTYDLPLVLPTVDGGNPTNAIELHSLGTKNKDLRLADNGSLTLYVQADEPADAIQRANWLPAPKGGDYSLYVRAYWPKAAIVDGSWTPSAVTRVT